MAEEVVTKNNEDMIQTRLREWVEQIGREENFSLESLDQKYEKYFVAVDETGGRRCVDGRKPLPESGVYLGSQLSGGTAGEVNALRLATGLGENEAREVLLQAYSAQSMVLGNHNDDDHGRITDPEELNDRFLGCGNQDQSAQGNLPMYLGLSLNESVVADRAKWIKANGFYPALTGRHAENGAAINLVDGMTFDTQTAVAEGNALFNLDVRAEWEFAPALYRLLPPAVKQSINAEQFREQMTKAVIRDYYQTLKALGNIRTVQVK